MIMTFNMDKYKLYCLPQDWYHILLSNTFFMDYKPDL